MNGAASTKVAVIIPCHNEEASIAQVLSRFPHAALKHHAIQLEIYVVDNRSTDATAIIAEDMGVAVVREAQKGKGNALRTGFKSIPPNTDYVVMLDGDGTYSPEEILRLLEPLQRNECDAVIGSRLSGTIQNAAMNRLNRFGNHLFTKATRLLYGAHITDALTGYFAWKKQALDALEPHLKSGGFTIEMEMITKMARLKLRMKSVPISYHPRVGRSHLRPFRDGLTILFTLLGNLRWQSYKTRQYPPRKIVFVSDAIYPYMKGGKEKRLHEITKHLAIMGYDVHIYTMHWWKDKAKHRVEAGVHLHAICKFYPLYNGDRRTIKEGIMFSLACFKLLRVQFDILDVDHMPFFPVLSTWLVCLFRRRKLHATWHEALTRQEWVGYMGPSGILASLLERFCILLPHHITAASAHTKRLLATTHGRNKRVGLVASGIDTLLMQSVQSAQAQCDVLYVGRLVKDKNIDKLILAMQLIVKSQPHLHCVIIGEGVEKPRLQELVMQLGLERNVTFMDPLPEAAEVYAFMKAARVFCSPSVREGFGIVSLEALGCNTPVVTINSPANAARHLIKHGKNGSIVQLDPIALADAILYWVSIAQKPPIAQTLTDCDWRQLAKKQAEVYTQ